METSLTDKRYGDPEETEDERNTEANGKGKRVHCTKCNDIC